MLKQTVLLIITLLCLPLIACGQIPSAPEDNFTPPLIASQATPELCGTPMTQQFAPYRQENDAVFILFDSSASYRDNQAIARRTIEDLIPELTTPGNTIQFAVFGDKQAEILAYTTVTVIDPPPATSPQLKATLSPFIELPPTLNPQPTLSGISNVDAQATIDWARNETIATNEYERAQRDHNRIARRIENENNCTWHDFNTNQIALWDTYQQSQQEQIDQSNTTLKDGLNAIPSEPEESTNVYAGLSRAGDFLNRADIANQEKFLIIFSDLVHVAADTGQWLSETQLDLSQVTVIVAGFPPDSDELGAEDTLETYQARQATWTGHFINNFSVNPANFHIMPQDSTDHVRILEILGEN